MKYLVVLGLVCLSIAGATKTYDGYKVYSVTPKTKSQADILLQLEKPLHLDFWDHPRALHRNATVMVQPSMQELFERTLRNHEVPYQVLISDVKRTRILEDVRQRLAPALPRGGVTFTKFMTQAEINSYLDTLAEEYSDIVTVEEIGKSYEGRSMKLITISSSKSANNPAIFIDAGIHAREWIAPPVALYVINQLVENATNRALYENVDWIVMPSLNPDGYEYTQTDERLWRKTRSKGRLCDGADANRNFGYHWMEGQGSDNYECSDIYGGSDAFSEIETANMRDYLLEKNQDEHVKVYLTLHSYGQYILYPWGWSETTPDPDNVDELDSLGNKVRDAILAVKGTDYLVGNSAKDLYPTAGASHDWAMGAADIPLSYAMELPGGGSFGFNPPASDIIAVVQETWEGIKVFQKHVEENYSKSGKQD